MPVGAGIRGALRRVPEEYISSKAGEELPPISLPDGRPSSSSGDKATARLWELVPASAIEQCKQVVLAQTRTLPHCESEERLSRLRMPRNHSEALLRRGAPMEEVSARAALRVLEKWVGTLRPFVSHEDLPRVLVALTHGQDMTAPPPRPDSRPSSQASSRPPSSADGGGSSPSRRPRPTAAMRVPCIAPPMSDPLGVALRRLVPLPREVGQKRWDFLDDVLDTLRLADGIETCWPDTAERQEMRRTCGFSEFSTTSEPAFLVAKDHTLQAGGAPSRRAPLSVNARVRLSGDFAWATFQENIGTRSTCIGFNPQVFNSQQGENLAPGPGAYGRPASRLLGRRGHFHSVGRLRPVGTEATLSQRGRFFFPKGDPWNVYKACDEV